MKANTKIIILKGILGITFLVILVYGFRGCREDNRHRTLTGSFEIEQIAQLATLKFKFEHIHVSSSDWWLSSKAYVISRQYEALLGIEPISQHDFTSIKVEATGPDPGDISISGYRVKSMSCSPVSDVKVLVDIGGMWNWLTKENRLNAQNELDQSAREFIQHNGALLKMAETNFINMVTVSRGGNARSNNTLVERKGQ